MRARRNIVFILALLLVLVLLSSSVLPSFAQVGNRARSVFAWIDAYRITVRSDVVVTDDFQAGGDFEIGEQTGITMTTGGTLAPTGSVQPIRSAGTIAFGAISGCNTATAGQLLVVTNDTNTTITITDSATLRLTGNLALGQFDTALLYCDGLTWVQLSTSNN